MRLPDAVQEFRRACQIGSLEHLPIDQRREALRLLLDLNFLRFGRSAPALDSVEDHLIQANGGALRVRLYRPHTGHRIPAHLFLHGGGWWQGSIDDLVNDATCHERALTAGVAVVAVDYRLAPEHPYPAALDDCCAALRWLIAESAELGIDPANVSVGGNSAGANLAAALSLVARDEGVEPLVLQVLEVPVLDLTLDTARRAPVATEPSPTVADLQLATAYYLDQPGRALDQLASPLLATDLRGLPPALVYTAEHDPLRTEGRNYAERLTQSDVPTRLVQVNGALHGSALLTRTWEPARTWQDDVAATLRRAHRVAQGQLSRSA